MVRPQEIQEIADAVRRRVLTHVLRTGGGYMSQACSSAELLTTLYARIMRIGESCGPWAPPDFNGPPGVDQGYRTGECYNGPVRPDLDRFVFSPSHYALVLYSLLIELGRMSPEAMDRYNVDGSTVEMIGAEHSPGFSTTTGSLAQGISQAAGMALGRKLAGRSGKVWVFMSDGEFAEGQTWEAVAFARHRGLDNIGVLVDANGQCCDGAVDSVLSIDPLTEKLLAFGATALEVDGHDPWAIEAAATAPELGRPLFVVCRTDPCRGLPLLRSRAPRLHYLRFSSDKEKSGFAAALASMTESGERRGGA